MLNLRSHILVSTLGSLYLHLCDLKTVCQLQQVKYSVCVCTAHQDAKLIFEGYKLAKLMISQNNQLST